MITSDIVNPLLAFGEALEISPSVWEKNETLERIKYSDSNLSQKSAKKLTIDLIVNLQEKYGEALFCNFLFGELVVLTINSNTNEKHLEEFHKFIESCQTITFEIILTKSRLIERNCEVIPDHRIFLYFFPSALERFLHSSLTKIETSLWDLGSVTSHKVIFLTPHHDIWLNGLYISVIGGKELKRWKEAFSPSLQENEERVQNMYNIRQKNLYWQVTWLKKLTPLHLTITEQTQLEDSIYKTLLIHQINLIMLYTASRTIGTQNNPTVSTYSGTNQSLEMKLLDLSNEIKDNINFRNVAYLNEMLKWAYDLEWSDDRLNFVQIVVSRTLCHVDPNMRYQAFIYNAETILKELNWNWRSFIEGKLNNYVLQVQALEDYVASTTQKFSDQITSMNKSLLDTMLAAVGAIIGSFIASLIKNTFNSQIFTTGLMCFAIYVFIFPLLYNMFYQWEQYKVVCENFEIRKKNFQERLYVDKVNEIVDEQITKSKNRFERWYTITCMIYVVIVVIVIIAAYLMPTYIQNTIPSS